MKPKDAQFIESIPLSRFQPSDRDGWYFTPSRKYTVKSDYDIKACYLDSGRHVPVFGLDIESLKAYSWKIKCPPKLKHIMWQIISG